jgi:hypothetical protein
MLAVRAECIRHFLRTAYMKRLALHIFRYKLRNEQAGLNGKAYGAYSGDDQSQRWP